MRRPKHSANISPGIQISHPLKSQYGDSFVAQHCTCVWRYTCLGFLSVQGVGIGWLKDILGWHLHAGEGTNHGASSGLNALLQDSSHEGGYIPKTISHLHQREGQNLHDTDALLQLFRKTVRSHSFFFFVGTGRTKSSTNKAHRFFPLPPSLNTEGRTSANTGKRSR